MALWIRLSGGYLNLEGFRRIWFGRDKTANVMIAEVVDLEGKKSYYREEDALTLEGALATITQDVEGMRWATEEAGEFTHEPEPPPADARPKERPMPF